MRRASKSICREYRRRIRPPETSKAEFKRFLWMAIGSADEMRVVGALCARSRLSRRANWRDVGETNIRPLSKMLQSLRDEVVRLVPAILCRPSSVLCSLTR